MIINEFYFLIFTFNLFLLINKNKLLLSNLSNSSDFINSKLKTELLNYSKQNCLKKNGPDFTSDNCYSRQFETYLIHLLNTYGGIWVKKNDQLLKFHVVRLSNKKPLN